MSSEWLGCVVSLDCGDSLGSYQGQVINIDHASQQLTINTPFRNGVKCEVPEVTIRASDIHDLKILKAAEDACSIIRKQSTPSNLTKNVQDTVTVGVCKPQAPSSDLLLKKAKLSKALSVPNGPSTYPPSAKQRHSPNGCQVMAPEHYYSNDHVSRSSPGFVSGNRANQSSGMNRLSPNMNTQKMSQLSVNDNGYSGVQNMKYAYNKNSWFPNCAGDSRNNNYSAQRSGNGCHDQRNAIYENHVNCYDDHRYTPTYEDQGQQQQQSGGGGGGGHGRPRRNSTSECRKKASTPRKIEQQQQQQQQQQQRRTPKDDCFSAPIDSFLGEFDFEKNLALFDKKAIFEAIEHKSEIVRPHARKNYRFDENVIVSTQPVCRQIHVNVKSCVSRKEYVTDSGMIVPSISHKLRSKVLSAAERCGFSIERQVEMLGRTASEMVLQLVGGSHRLNPQNQHQSPVVVVMCGLTVQGSQGLNCARHLANHDVTTLVFLNECVKLTPLLEEEKKLCVASGCKVYTDSKHLPAGTVDLIVNAMEAHSCPFQHEQPWYKAAAKWANEKLSPVIAVDPPEEGVAMETKWSLGLVLPLSLPESCGQVYLCDLGIPKSIFQQSGIEYVSVFAHKFVIPLHTKS